MDRNPYKELQKQLDYAEYVTNQYNNPVDLTLQMENENENDSVRLLAETIFSKSERHVLSQNFGILMNEDAEPADMFCMILELFLYGFDIISGKKSILNLIDSTDDFVYKMKTYLKSIGIKLTVYEIFDEDVNINLYRDRDDYYCNVTSKPPDFLHNTGGWHVLDYRILNNRKFKFDGTTPLVDFKAFFINRSKRICTVSFDLIN